MLQPHVLSMPSLQYSYQYTHTLNAWVPLGLSSHRNSHAYSTPFSSLMSVSDAEVAQLACACAAALLFPSLPEEHKLTFRAQSFKSACSLR